VEPVSGSEVVVVTGASAGIGRAIVREFAARAAHPRDSVAAADAAEHERSCGPRPLRIGLLARGLAGLEGARRDVEALCGPGSALVIPTDVSDAAAVERAAALVEERFGPIDVWINNAMISVFSPFLEMEIDEYRRVTDVVYHGYVNGTMAALRRMVPRDRGVIIQVGSGVAYRGIPLQSAYSGAKHAIKGFTEAVIAELKRDHSRVRVSMVHLPSVNTPQFSWVKARIPQKPRPFKPVFQPEVAGGAVYWAAHHRRREVFVTAGAVAVTAINKVIPHFLDFYMGWKGFEGQMYDGPPGPEWQDYVWRPVDEDRGAHGDFDAGAHSRSVQLWMTFHRRALLTAAMTAAGTAWVGLRLSRGARLEARPRVMTARAPARRSQRARRG
jgi:NAD(P)-dependent dehydrogenase (short-subunit alcohol dehydrogenase family)